MIQNNTTNNKTSIRSYDQYIHIIIKFIHWFQIDVLLVFEFGIYKSTLGTLEPASYVFAIVRTPIAINIPLSHA